MNDEEILRMPSRRFWSMERQIARIRAESDLRGINVGVALTNQDALEKTTNILVLELGDTAEIKRSLIVKGDEDRKMKFAKMMTGG